MPQSVPLTSAEVQRIPVGISSCLIGEAVRFDGGHKRHSYIVNTLGKYFDFRSFCPEVTIGMGVPRKPIRLVRVGEDTRSVGVADPDFDVTDALDRCADEQKVWQHNIYGYILKKGSPSCGMERVKRYRGDHPQGDGVGIYAARMMQNFPHLPVEEEGRLGDPVLRENFVQRVFAYRRWREIIDNSPDIAAVTDFHARHKFTLLSHHQDRTRALGSFLGGAGKLPIAEVIERYIEDFTAIMRCPATRKNHVNVLQHIQGFLKQELDSADKAEMTEVIEGYRLGELPLIVPLTLLRHHFRRNPDPFIERSHYLYPHPQEMMLLNHI